MNFLQYFRDPSTRLKSNGLHSSPPPPPIPHPIPKWGVGGGGGGGGGRAVINKNTIKKAKFGRHSSNFTKPSF